VPNLQDFIGVTSLYLSQSRYDIDSFLAERPGSHTVGKLYDSKRFHPRLDLFTAIAEEAPEDPEEDPDYHRGLAARDEFRRSILNVMASQDLDALVYPNSQVLPPTREELDDWKWTVLTFPTNALIAAQADLPSISLPAGFAEGGVPVGFELVGKPYGEADLLRLAYAYEDEAGQRRPPESAPPLSDEPQ
jgi:amidase